MLANRNFFDRYSEQLEVGPAMRIVAQTSRMIRALLQFACLVLILVVATGCEQTSNSADKIDLAEQQAKYLLADEPPGAQSILAIREQLQEGKPYVVFGRIGGVPDPWLPGSATFVIADPVAQMELGPDGHACHDGCAFCKKQQGNPTRHLATVRLVNQAGETVPIDARKLLDLEVDDMVVVRGTIKTDKLGNLTVHAEGVHVRR